MSFPVLQDLAEFLKKREGKGFGRRWGFPRDLVGALDDPVSDPTRGGPLAWLSSMAVKFYFVDGTNGSDRNDGLSWDRAKKTIQAAVTEAEPWSVIYIAEGSYTESVTIVVTKQGLTILGVSKYGTKVTGLGQKVFDIYAANVRIMDLESECYGVDGGDNGVCFYMESTAHFCVVERCACSTNATWAGRFPRGVWCVSGASGIKIRECTFEDGIMWTACKIYSSDGEVANCLVSINSGGETLLIDGDRNLIYENTVQNGKYGMWLGVNSDDNSVFHNNLINNSSHNGADESGDNYWFENFYSDHSAPDVDNDGVRNTKYSLAGGGGVVDWRPLTNRDGWHERSLGSEMLCGGFGGGKVEKAVTFSNTTGVVSLFTVTGDVVVRVVAVCATGCASAGGCSGEVGIAGSTAGIIAATDMTLLAAREIWHDASPDAEIEALGTMREFIVSDGNDIVLTLSAQVDSGGLAFYCFWTKLSSDGNVVAA